MIDTTAVALALIATIVPTATIILTWLQAKTKISEVHQVVNSRLDAALLSNEAFKAEIRRLNSSESSLTPPTPLVSKVTLGQDGQVTVSKTPPVTIIDIDSHTFDSKNVVKP